MVEKQRFPIKAEDLMPDICIRNQSAVNIQSVVQEQQLLTMNSIVLFSVFFTAMSAPGWERM